MSQQKYINTLRGSGNWIVGTVQFNSDKPTAEEEAFKALSRSIRTHVVEEINREINELISSDESFLSERRRISSSVITNETITGVEVFAIEKDGIWWAIALKCKEEYSKERKDYNEGLYFESKSYFDKYKNQSKSLSRSTDISSAFEHLIKSHILINSLTFFDQDKLDLLENNNKALKILLGKLTIEPTKKTIEVFPLSNKEIDIKCEYYPEIIQIIPMDGIDFIAEYTKGSVEDFNGWGNNKKNFSVIDGNLKFDTGYINTQTADLEVLIYPDVDYVVSSINEKYQLKDQSYKISPEAIKKLKEQIREKSYKRNFVLNLKNGGKIPTFIKIESTIRIPKNKIRNKIKNNPLFKVTNNPEDASVTISIQKDDNAINIALSRKNQVGELEKIDEKFIRRRDGSTPTSFSGLDLTNIVNAIGQLLDSIFETNLEFEIAKYKDCDENVTIVIENEKYDMPKEFKNFPGQTREGTIPVKKGRVNYKIYYNRDKSSAIYDTTFYVNSVQDLNDFRNICFEKKRIPYALTFSESIIPERKSQLIWDGENHKINSIGTKLYGFGHSKHNIVYIKNGFKPFKKTINPTNDIEYPIYVDPEKVRLNIVNNFKHIILPGRSQIELYRASFPKKMQGYIYQASYLYFIGKMIYQHNQYFNRQEKYDNALMNYNSSLDQTPEYYQTLYDEVNYQHNLMSQELSDFEIYG
nr:hypothetical protein [Pelagibacterales bacterium]